MLEGRGEILEGSRDREERRFFLQEVDDLFLLRGDRFDLLLQTLHDVL